MNDTTGILEPAAGTSGDADSREAVLPAALAAELPKLLSRLADDGEGGVELQLDRLDAVMAVEGFDGPSLLAAAREPDEDDPSARLIVASLCLLAKADADLERFDGRGEGGERAEELAAPLDEDAELFAELMNEFKSAIGAAVLRGRLRPARLLSRFKESLPALDAQLELALGLLREERLLRDLDAAAALEAEQDRADTAPEAMSEAGESEREEPPEKAPFRPSLRLSSGPGLLGADSSSWPWMGSALLVVLLAGVFTLHVVRSERAGSFAAVEAGEVANLVDLVAVNQVGSMLIGTVSEHWATLDYRTRTAQFERLWETASEQGFPAVVLFDKDGALVARWSKDSIALVHGTPHPG